MADKKEIKTELSFEEVAALYFDESALKTPAYKLFRMDGGDNRFYYMIDPETKEPIFFTSVTSAIKNNLPTSEHLINWKVELGVEESEAFMMERAAYGTYMHKEICDFMLTKKIDYDTLSDRILDWGFRIGRETKHWYWELRKDLLSFQQFASDVNLEPFAIEVVLASKDGIAGALDLVCKLDVEETGFFGEEYKSGEKKGQPKETKRKVRVRAILDFKSGKKGFYDSHIVQLHMYRKMWNENFPSVPIERLFNWAPKDWRDNVGYSLTEKTDKWIGQLMTPIIEMNKIRVANDNVKPRDFMKVSGIGIFGTDVADNYSKTNIVEHIKNKKV